MHRSPRGRTVGDRRRTQTICSLGQSGWAREFYDQKPAAGKSYRSALRALGKRWLEILWQCLARACSTTRPSTSPTATAPSNAQSEGVVDQRVSDVTTSSTNATAACVPSTPHRFNPSAVVDE